MCMYLPVVMFFCDYLPVWLCAINWQKIDQEGGPETFFKTLAGLDTLQCST